MAKTASFMIAGRNNIPINEAEVGTAFKNLEREDMHLETTQHRSSSIVKRHGQHRETLTRVSLGISDEKLSWKPEIKLPFSTVGRKNESAKASVQMDGQLDKRFLQATGWKNEKQLQDGLLVPPRDPKKLNKLARKEVKDTLGDKWFEMPAQTITPELKNDLQLLKLRGVFDPKRHYKADDSKGLPKYFQVGTVIEPASEFYSGRLTKKERKVTIADELLSDSAVGLYSKRKYLEIQEEKQAGRKKSWKQKKNHQKSSRSRA